MMKAAPTLRHIKCKKPVAERGWAEIQSGWRHEAFERKTPGFKCQVKELRTGRSQGRVLNTKRL